MAIDLVRELADWAADVRKLPRAAQERLVAAAEVLLAVEQNPGQTFEDQGDMILSACYRGVNTAII